MTSYANNFHSVADNISSQLIHHVVCSKNEVICIMLVKLLTTDRDLLIEGKHTWCRHVRFCDNLQTTYQRFLTKDCLGIDD